MKLWQKIFIPSMMLMMIGIFTVSLGLIIRNHTVQLETEKQLKDAQEQPTLLLENGIIQYQGCVYLSGNLCEIRISNNVSVLLKQFQEDVGVVPGQPHKN